MDELSESQEDRVNLTLQTLGDSASLVTVKFYTPDAKVFTQSFPVDATICKIKRKFTNLFAVPYENISLLHNEEIIPEERKLEKLQPDKYGILELKLLSNDTKYKINVENAYKDLAVPDILTVKVETGHEGIKDVVVEIENRAVDKPNLGGFKHIQTGIKYLHGYTQTGPPPPKVPPERKNHRDTQTYFTRNRKTENDYSRATQMPNKEIYIPNVADRLVTPGPYETADEREKRLDIEGKVRTIQRYYRAWKLNKCLKELSEEYEKRVRLEQERDEREKREDEARKRRDLVSKVFPMTSADFAMIYTMIERWKKSEIDRITSIHCGPSKIAEFYLLLEKEIQMLRSIESLRMKVSKDVERKKKVDFFKAIGDPIEWDSAYKHIHIQMDTLETQKGREYFALYKKLCDKTLNTEEKIQVYLSIKDYLDVHECHQSEQILRLVDRACELLARGMDEKHLKMLEKRIEALVLRHFQLSECNEGVTRHAKAVREKMMEKNLLYCHRCQKLKTIDMFTLNARIDKVKICTSCKWIDKAEEPWVDLSPYRFILRQIRNYERLHHASSSVAFILQDKDIHHIVTNIWHCHSALSECSEIYQLRLCRWKINEEWSPWNCILLTIEEAKAHLRLLNLEEVYEEEFINHVFNKHALAKKHFSQLMTYDKHFTELAEGDPKLDENSEYYNKPVHDCLFGPI